MDVGFEGNQTVTSGLSPQTAKLPDGANILRTSDWAQRHRSASPSRQQTPAAGTHRANHRRSQNSLAELVGRGSFEPAPARTESRSGRSTTPLSAWSRRRRSVFASSWKARIATGRTSAITGRRSITIFLHATTASASSPRTTAACGTRPATRSISPSPRRTIRPPGSARRAWPPFWHCSGRCTATASIRSRRNSTRAWKRASASARASPASCTTRCCRAFRVRC